jgi:hypothetical protein
VYIGPCELGRLGANALGLKRDIADEIVLCLVEAASQHQENQDDHDDIHQRRHVRAGIVMNLFCALNFHNFGNSITAAWC